MAMPPVYTKRLFEGVLDPTVLRFPGPPSGFQWVISSITLMAQGLPPFITAQWGEAQIQTEALIPIFGVGGAGLTPFYPYVWSGRQVINEFEPVLYQVTWPELWTAAGTGYELSLP